VRDTTNQAEFPNEKKKKKKKKKGKEEKKRKKGKPRRISRRRHFLKTKLTRNSGLKPAFPPG